MSISGNLTPHRHAPTCSVGRTRKLETGHLAGLATANTTTALCSLLAGGPLPDLAGGTIKWSPTGRIASSTGLALTGGSVSVITTGTQSFVRITYTGGSIVGGSFAAPSGVSLTATSREDTTRLAADCARGPLRAISVTGSLTL